MTRMAISPRLATRTLENMRRARLFHRELWRSVTLKQVFEGPCPGRTAETAFRVTKFRPATRQRGGGERHPPHGARGPGGHHLGQGGGGGQSAPPPTPATIRGV